MKFDPETIYDLAADTARILVGELYRDRDEKNIESVYKCLLNKPEDFMIIPGLASVCKLLKMAADQMGDEQAGKAAPALRRLVKNNPREEQRGVFLDEQGRQIACDGARAVRLTRLYAHPTAAAEVEDEDGKTFSVIDVDADPTVRRPEDPECAALQRETLRAVIAAMPAAYQGDAEDVLKLSIIHGYTAREIAEFIGCSERRIKRIKEAAQEAAAAIRARGIC